VAAGVVAITCIDAAEFADSARNSVRRITDKINGTRGPKAALMSPVARVVVGAVKQRRTEEHNALIRHSENSPAVPR
jgi:hypothetical protein